MTQEDTSSHYRWLWGTMWMLRTKPKSSARPVSTLIRWMEMCLQIRNLKEHFKSLLRNTGQKEWTQAMVAWIRIACIGSDIWMLSHQGVTLFKRIRRCGLGGESVSLEVEFEGSKTHAKPRVSLGLKMRLKLSGRGGGEMCGSLIAQSSQQ